MGEGRCRPPAGAACLHLYVSAAAASSRSLWMGCEFVRRRGRNRRLGVPARDDSGHRPGHSPERGMGRAVEHSERVFNFAQCRAIRMTEMNGSETMSALPRFLRFLRKPLHDKSRSLYVHWKRVLPKVPFPVRLPFGAWWIARHDYLSSTLSYDGFERAERVFVQRFLRPGMTVIDIGAHHGFYTLLMSKRVGRSGRVFAFEPSPRERRALYLHLALNLGTNVTVVRAGLGQEDGYADLYVAARESADHNSLRPPDAPQQTTKQRVHICRLDRWLSANGIGCVDFIKLDAEGAERDILAGSMRLLTSQPRPV